jgi:NADH-quinone oxidoreductase subunit L
VAVLTTFYMLRLFAVAFLGKPRSAAAEHAHEVPGAMSVPLLVLAVPSVLAGLWGIDTAIAAQFSNAKDHGAAEWFGRLFLPFNHAPLVALASLGAVALGAMLAWPLYANAARDPLSDRLGWLARAMRRRFYLDEIYDALIAITQESIAALANAIDQWVIAGFVVRGAHGTTELVGRALRLVQTGNLQTYAFVFAMGVALLLFFMLR